MYSNRLWTTDGIVTTIKVNTVICNISHLTYFAVLIDPIIASSVRHWSISLNLASICKINSI